MVGQIAAITFFVLSITVGPALLAVTAYLFRKFERVKEIKDSSGLLDSFGTLYINSPFDVEVQQHAIDLFIKEYISVFGCERNIIHVLLGTRELSKARKKLTIEWIPNSPWFWSRDWYTGKEFKDNSPFKQRNSGQMVGMNKIVVAAGSDKIWETAFVHELGHWALGIMTGEQDADHALSTTYGNTWTVEMDNLIESINASLKNMKNAELLNQPQPSHESDK
jgi:hypothetical protein